MRASNCEIYDQLNRGFLWMVEFQKLVLATEDDPERLTRRKYHGPIKVISELRMSSAI